MNYARKASGHTPTGRLLHRKPFTESLTFDVKMQPTWQHFCFHCFYMPNECWCGSEMFPAIITNALDCAVTCDTCDKFDWTVLSSSCATLYEIAETIKLKEFDQRQENLRFKLWFMRKTNVPMLPLTYWSESMITTCVITCMGNLHRWITPGELYLSCTARMPRPATACAHIKAHYTCL